MLSKPLKKSFLVQDQGLSHCALLGFKCIWKWCECQLLTDVFNKLVPASLMVPIHFYWSYFRHAKFVFRHWCNLQYKESLLTMFAAVDFITHTNKSFKMMICQENGFRATGDFLCGSTGQNFAPNHPIVIRKFALSDKRKPHVSTRTFHGNLSNSCGLKSTQHLCIMHLSIVTHYDQFSWDTLGNMIHSVTVVFKFTLMVITNII